MCSTLITAPDYEGQELVDQGAARAIAAESARQLASDEVRKGCIDFHCILVTNSGGDELERVTFGDVVRICAD